MSWRAGVRAYRRAALAVAGALGLHASTPARLHAFQCPDGTPPPCAGAQPPPPDPRRIAILPFHVTSADTLLGEGIAELLATEFTGESGPRAAHMGSVLRAWRRAGGDLRTPLGEGAAGRVAREIDAGQYIEGSVVGLGSRLTLSASVVATAGGTARRVGPVSGPADSLEVLVGRLAAALLGVTGRERLGAETRLTDSPQAMLAYLDGLAWYRRSDFERAAGAFERALDLDSSFARAALMLYLTAGWADGDTDKWAQLTWERRARLSAADRVLLTAFFGQRYPDPRSPEANLADRRGAVSQLPESPEAHFGWADFLYHEGGASNFADPLAQARAGFERSLALDTQATTLGHLLDVGLYTADTTLLRRYWPAYDRAVGPGPSATSYGIAIAARTGDTALAAAMARRPARLEYQSLVMASQAAAVNVDSLLLRYDQLVPAADSRERGRRDWLRAYSLVAQGRPSAVRALRDGMRDPSAAARVDQVLVLSALFGGGDSSDAARSAARLASAMQVAREQAGAMCVRALWAVHTGSTPRYDPLLLAEAGWRVCAASLDVLLAWRGGAPDREARLATADSVLRWDIANVRLESHSFEHLILSRLWEDRGDLVRAAATVRLHFNGFGSVGWSQAITAHEEGRLAALVGDTASALRAYRRYLDLRRDAEPALIPQRDSVRAELARLTRN